MNRRTHERLGEIFLSLVIFILVRSFPRWQETGPEEEEEHGGEANIGGANCATIAAIIIIQKGSHRPAPRRSK